MYDIVYVGAGPSTIFSILTLLKGGYRKKIAIVEKGKSLKYRPKNEVISGWGGAGTFSDSKLTASLDVGGTIPGMTQGDLDNWKVKILEYFNQFKRSLPNCPELEWDKTTLYDTGDSGLNWDVHATCHVGTDNGQAIFAEMEKYISSFDNVDVLFDSEVKEVVRGENQDYLILKLDKGDHLEAKKVVVATGQKNGLPSKVLSEFNLDKSPRAFQLGVRVVDEINPQYEEIIKANYDFKFTKEYSYDNVKVRVRTFCCNSGNAHTCVENNKEGFQCFNGHAYKEPDPNNHSVNYGIMCEITGLKGLESKEKQIDCIKNINAIKAWREDNLDEDGNPTPKRKLLDGFDHLHFYYPEQVIDSLRDFTLSLNKVVNLDKAYYLYPEVKLSGYIPALDYSTFSTCYPGLYMIGDAVISRGIFKSTYTGYKLAEAILEEEKKDESKY